MKPISRRNMLGKASLMGTTVAVGLPLAAATTERQTKERPDAKTKLKVVVTGGHPGDPDCGCGGTIARYTPAMVTRMRGVESGHQQAEGYIRHVQSPDFALPMTS